MHTDRELLDRVPSFAEQRQRRPSTIANDDLDEPDREPVVCDSCRRVVDQEAEPGRFRHRACNPPAIPPGALEALQRIRERIDTRRDQP